MLSVAVGSADDLDDVMEVMTTAFDPAHGEAWSAAQCAGALSMPGALLLIARYHDSAVGFALARTVLEESELLLLAVCPRKRNLGVGRALVARLLRQLQAQQVTKVILEVRETNQARAFYAQSGFKEVGFRKNYYRGMSGIYTHAVTLARNVKDDHQ